MPDAWHDQCAAIAQAPLVSLTALQRQPGGAIELWLATADGSRLSCSLSDGSAESVADLWPAAAWFERRIAAEFGVSFGEVPAGAGGLLKAVGLAGRNQVAWPGLKDPTDREGAPSRRRSLPPGVFAEVDGVELR